AATGVGQWSRAESAAQAAIEAATSRGEAQILFQAEAVLMSARSQLAVASNSSSVEPIQADSGVVVEEFVEALALVGAGAGCSRRRASLALPLDRLSRRNRRCRRRDGSAAGPAREQIGRAH